MYDKETEMILDEITESLKIAGFEPFEQMTGYLNFGNELYITRLNNARDKIKVIDKSLIKRYMEEHQNK